MADATREICNAVILHRSLISSTPLNSSSSTSSVNYYNNNSSHSQYCCYYNSLVESMPTTGPTWSTTAPSTHATPPPPPPPQPQPQLESIEIELWGKEIKEEEGNYSWWCRFLEALDAKKVVPLMAVKEYQTVTPLFNGGVDQNISSSSSSSLDEWIAIKADYHLLPNTLRLSISYPYSNPSPPLLAVNRLTSVTTCSWKEIDCN
ncbi:hypothetical protein ACFE04_000224 [Oxalis oulophora]